MRFMQEIAQESASPGLGRAKGGDFQVRTVRRRPSFNCLVGQKGRQRDR